MSYSPSYSPVSDIVDRNIFLSTNNEQEGTTARENLLDNSITNPFYYAQDRESWYSEVAAKACDEARQQKVKEQALKKKKNKSFKNKSFVIRKESQRARHLIKIIIHDLNDCDASEKTDPDNASVNVQYLVTSDYDEIMNETEHLVNKIVKKIGKLDS